MVRAIPIFELFLMVAFLGTGVSICAQVPADGSAEAWEKAPTEAALMERFKQRDAAFGDYLIEFDLTKTRKRNPRIEWLSTNWKRSLPPAKPVKPPEDLEPPHLELIVRRYQFATQANEEHMDWYISEVRKDGKKDEEDYRNCSGARYSTWGEFVRSEYYSAAEEEKPLKEIHEGDPTVAQLHKDNPAVPHTILDSNRMYYELCAGIGMSKGIEQIDTMEVRDGLLHVSGKISHVWGNVAKFEMELTPSLLPRRILISNPLVTQKDGTETRSKFVVQTEGELSHELAPDTPESVKFEFSTTITFGRDAPPQR